MQARRVIVKGSLADAAGQAAVHGLRFEALPDQDGFHGSISGFVVAPPGMEDFAEARLNRWFDETGGPGFPPYPPGALMWFAASTFDAEGLS